MRRGEGLKVPGCPPTAEVAEASGATDEQVFAATQETSASTQEIAVAAHQLAGTARELERLVGRFELA